MSRYFSNLTFFSKIFNTKTAKMSTNQAIIEGKAKIQTSGHVFYNPVQEFNRDLSISVIRKFTRLYLAEKQKIDPTALLENAPGTPHPSGVRILEALSATGLRSIRYAKEIPLISEIIANDISAKAVTDIEQNIKLNHVESLVKASHDDATMLMYRSRGRDAQFDVIDLDPYGCPSIFLDSALQAVRDGGLLLVTATDMAVLAGNAPETCHSKYGAVSLRAKACHEMALRILLQCVEAHANRYGRYTVPLLSLSADFYIRIFVRVFTSPKKCKHTLSKLSMVYHCTGCGSFELRPLGVTKINPKTNQVKFGLPTTVQSGQCEHCRHPYHIGGPIWNAPLHNGDFIDSILADLDDSLGTVKRIQGVLSVMSEELADSPLYYTLEQLSGTLHLETPSMINVRSAILNAGYSVSYTHMNKTSIKTNAPGAFLWDVMREWAKTHPVNAKHLVAEFTPVRNILGEAQTNEVRFDFNADANPESKKSGFLRFQQNPLPNWGPGTRATAMIGENCTQDKKIRNQNKRKAETVGDSIVQSNSKKIN